MAKQIKKRGPKDGTNNNGNRTSITGKGKSNSYGSKFVRKDKMNEVKSQTNDVSWYLTYPDLTANSGKLNTVSPAGKLFNSLDNTTMYTTDTSTKSVTSLFNSVPGVMVFDYYPTVGNASNPDDPVNLMSRRQYNTLVSTVNRTPTYEHTDLTMYQLAQASAMTYYYYLTKLYLLTNSYKVMNNYWNKAFFKGMYVDGQDVIDNRSKLYNFIVDFAGQMSVFPFPSDMFLFNKAMQIASSIYKDDDGEKGQLFTFRPKGIYIYTEPTEGGGAYLQMTDIPGTSVKLATVNDLITFGRTILRSVSGSSDYKDMSSDILRIYKDSLITLAIPPQFGAIEAIKDYNILAQVANMDMLDTPILATFKISQTTTSALEPCLVAQPRVGWSVNNAGIYARKHLMNFWLDDPDPATVIEYSRFMTSLGGYSNKQYGITSCGTEVIVGNRVVLTQSASGGDMYQVLSVNSAIDVSIVGNWIVFVALSKFDWAPRVSLFNLSTTAASAVVYYGDLVDLSNYAFVELTDLSNFHYAALMNLFKARG